MCQTDLEPKNVGLCLCVPLAQKYQKLSLESLRVLGFQDTIKRFSSDLPVLWCIFMLRRHLNDAKITQVITGH